jgi:NADP-dependent 3-hydroxy acid dehydrogenase YdfG
MAPVVVTVTGASSGGGRATTQAFARQGATVLEGAMTTANAQPHTPIARVTPMTPSAASNPYAAEHNHPRLELTNVATNALKRESRAQA